MTHIPKEQYEKEIQKYAKDVLDAGFDKGFTTPMNIQDVMEELKAMIIEATVTPKEMQGWLETKLKEAYQLGRKDMRNEAIEIVESVKIISPSGVSDDILEPMQMLFDKEWKSKIKSSLTKLV